MSDITQNLLNTISMMTAHAVSNAHFDRTIEAVIMACEDQALGIYKVKYQDSIWRAYSNNTNTKYNAGTSVYILVPGNDMSKNKTILGTVNSLGKDYIDYVSNEQNYIENGNSVITSTSGTEYGLCSYKISDTLNLLNEENFSLDVNAAKEYLSTSEYILLKADFRTNLQKQQRRAGNYGLKVKLKFKTPENSNKTYEMNYVLDIDNMVGNPYILSVPLTQKVYFAIDGANFVSIQNIEIFSEGFEHQDDNKPDDIFISNIEIIGANTLTTQEKQGISLRFKRPKGYMFTQNDISSDVRTTIAQIRVSNKLLSSSAKVDYYWFEQDATIDAGSVYYSKYGGKGWRCLNKLNDSSATDIKFLPESDTFVRKKSQIVAERVKFKCVAIYEGKEISNTFEIINLDSNYIIEITCDREPVFYPNIDSLQLTCVVKQRSSGTELPDVEYHWKMITQHNIYESLNENSNILTIYSNNIRNYNDYYCSVYKTGNLIGTTVLRVTKNAEPENRYILSIVNGVQLFSYDEKGESPYGNYRQNNLSIPQLSFTVTDVVTGLDVTDQVKDIVWTIPLKNTLLTDENQVSEQVDPQAEYKEYTNLQNFTYGIADDYAYNKTNNEIKLKVIIHGIELQAKTNFTFIKEGNPGTNGTDIICKIVAFKNNERVPGWLIGKYKNGTKTYNWDSIIVQLWRNGECFYSNRNSQNGEGQTSIQVEWSFLNNNDNTLWYTIPKNEQGQITSNQIVIFNPTADLAMNSMDWNSEKGYPADILKVTVTYDKKRKYFDTRPIVTFYGDDSAKNDISLKSFSGFQYAVYSEDGEQPSYDNTTPFTIIQPEERQDLTWLIIGSVKKGYNNFQKLTESALNLENDSFKNQQNNFIDKGDNFYFRPKTTYDGLCVTNALFVKGTHFWFHIPIHLMYNRYGHKQLNDWDGNSIVMNDEENNQYILTPQIGAGIKEDDNSFTGLMMGTSKIIGKQSSLYNIETGLLGYNKGERTIFLDAKTGKAQFGKGKAGRIVIDPTAQEGQPQALIYGGDYQEKTTDKQGTGMLINLTNPSIQFGSKKFIVDEQQFTVGEDKIVYNANDNSLSLKLDQFSLKGNSFEQNAQKVIDSNDFDTENLLVDSLNLTSTNWIIQGDIEVEQDDPHGTKKAILLKPVSNEQAYLLANSTTNNPFKDVDIEKYYRLSVWLKQSKSSTKTIKIYINNESHEVKLTTTWKQYWFNIKVTSSATSNQIKIGGSDSFTSLNEYNLYIYNPRVFYIEKPETLEEMFNRLTNNSKDQGIYTAKDADGNVKAFVNLSYAKTGILSVSNSNKVETLYVNANTGEVRINANSISVSGTSVGTIATNAANNAAATTLTNAKSYVDAKMKQLDTNLLKDSLGLSDTYWRYKGTFTRNQSDPKGGTNAVMLTPPSGDEGYLQAIPSTNNPFNRTGIRYKLSVWLKASTNASSGKGIKLYLNGIGSSDIFPTTAWAQYEMSGTVNTPFSPNDLVTIGGFSSFTSSDGYSLYIYDPIVEYTFTHEEIYKALSNDGANQGWWMVNNHLYMNMSYLQGGTAKFGGVNNGNGSIEIYNDAGQQIGSINNAGFKLSSYSGWGKDYVTIENNIFSGYWNNKRCSYIVFAAKYSNNRTATAICNLGAEGIRLQGYGRYKTTVSEPDSIVYDPDFIFDSSEATEMWTSGPIDVAVFYKDKVVFYKPIEGGLTISTGDLTVSNGQVSIPKGGISGSGFNINSSQATFNTCILAGGAFYFNYDNQGTHAYSIISTYDIHCPNRIQYGSLIQISDRKLKTNIQKINNNIINQLNVVSFDWKKNLQHVSAGLIAQQVKEVCPELVDRNKDGFLSINFVGMIPHLIHQVQCQKKEIEFLKREIQRKHEDKNE